MTREEMMISMGLDFSRLQTGMPAVDMFLQNSLDNTTKSLKRLLAVNLAQLGAQAATFLADKAIPALAKSFWDGIYGIDDGSRMDAMRKNMRKIASELSDLRKKVAKEAEDAEFAGLTDVEKFRVLKEKQLGLDSKLNETKKKQIEFERAARLASRPEDRASLILVAAEAEKQHLQYLSESIDLNKKLANVKADIAEGFAKKGVATFEQFAGIPFLGPMVAGAMASTSVTPLKQQQQPTQSASLEWMLDVSAKLDAMLQTAQKHGIKIQVGD